MKSLQAKATKGQIWKEYLARERIWYSYWKSGLSAIGYFCKQNGNIVTNEIPNG